jgi:hypothetical protein
MLRYFPPERRRRLAPLFLVAGLFTVGKLAYEEVPRGQDVRFILPPTKLKAVKVLYSSQNEFYGGLERHFPDGSPREVLHTPSLSPGEYDVTIELTEPDGKIKRLSRSLTVPSEGALRIRLTESE